MIRPGLLIRLVVFTALVAFLATRRATFQKLRELT